LTDVVDVLHGAIYSKGLSIKKRNFFYSISTYNRYLIRYFR
jgi:hypothetical protein